jgi:UDP-N-acetylglucosamine 2-epimerase (non-hydrolysing)
MKILLVAGARPNFMKIAPIHRALSITRQAPPHDDSGGRHPFFQWKIVHTGQHYDYEMSQSFFDDLELPRPDFFLETGSGSHAVQTAKVMTAFEDVCEKEKPNLVIVVGDVNSTLACSIVAKKLFIKVAHVEAGLRSFDMTMPEEINRIVTDAIADYFFVTERSAVDNLVREGKSRDRIFFVGHVMVDNLLYQFNQLSAADVSQYPSYQLKNDLGKYIFLTLHRPSNVDQRETLAEIAEALNQISVDMPIVFPVHPRTRMMLDAFSITLSNRVSLLPPLGFKESLNLWKNAILVITDSGGLQEETTVLGVPCLTLRENTERPITVELGTNTLAGNKKETILRCYEQIMRDGARPASIPPKWDGRAAKRIVEILFNLKDNL